MIDSEVRTELGGLNYVKKCLIFKGNNKIAIRDDIPRRWLEQVGTSDGGFSQRKSSFEGAAGLNGMLAVPDGYNPNNLAMSDDFKIANHNNSASDPLHYKNSQRFVSFKTNH